MPEFNWIGRLAPGVDMIVTWWTTGIKTIADATKVPSLPVGATGAASGTSLYPLMLNNLVGTRFEVIPGYKHNEMLLAVERGETAGAFTSLATLKTQFARWITDKRINVLVVLTPERVAEFPAAPTLVELATNTADRQVMGIFANAGAIGRSFMTTPRVPADHILRPARGVYRHGRGFRVSRRGRQDPRRVRPALRRGAAKADRRYPQRPGRGAGARPCSGAPLGREVVSPSLRCG